MKKGVRFPDITHITTHSCAAPQKVNIKQKCPIPSKPYPYITCFLMGGLGNQMFQIFTTMAYAFQNNYGYIFPYSETLNTGLVRPTYWNTLFESIKSSTIDAQTAEFHNLPRYNEVLYYKYYPIPPSAAPGILIGYFQSYKYFDNYYEQIIDHLNLKEKRRNVRQKYFDETYTDFAHIVSMHFRIGDYAQKQDYHPVMKYEYYKCALDHICSMRENINKPIVILYFCEKENNAEVLEMISRLEFSRKLSNRNEINKTTCIFLKVDDNISDWEQMLLMSCCHDHIIANSTFSWWGAYLNEREDKIVCYPKKWLGVNLLKDGYDIIDLIPEKWIEI